MRIFAVVFIFSYIQLAPGFIVPLRLPDKLSKRDNGKSPAIGIEPTKLEFAVATEKEKETDKPIYISSEVKRSLKKTASINESELYKDVTPKSKNVNERSFVYLNKGYINPHLFLQESREENYRKFPAIMTNYLDTDFGNADLSDRFYAANTGQKIVDEGFINSESIANNQTHNIDNYAFVELLRPPILRPSHRPQSKYKHNIPSTIISSKSLNAPNKEGYFQYSQLYGSKYGKVNNKAQAYETIPRESKEYFLTKNLLPKQKILQDLYNNKIEESHTKMHNKESLSNAQIHHNIEDYSHYRDTYKHNKNSSCRGQQTNIQDCYCNTKMKVKQSKPNVKRTSIEDYETIINHGLSKIISSTELTEGEDIMEYLPNDELQNV